MQVCAGSRTCAVYCRRAGVAACWQAGPGAGAAVQRLVSHSPIASVRRQRQRLALALSQQADIEPVQTARSLLPPCRDASKGQPVYTPYALTLLELALAAPGIAYVPSIAPGGAGLTAILYADREPFAPFAAHLASFGCQVCTWLRHMASRRQLARLLACRGSAADSVTALNLHAAAVCFLPKHIMTNKSHTHRPTWLRVQRTTNC